MGAAAAPARADRPRPAGQERAADRADRRRQDPGGLPAVIDRAHRAAARRQGSRPQEGQGRAAHALHLAAEGAGHRHPPQPRDADRRDGAAGARRKPHRRHAAEPAPAPARAAARSPDDHAGIAGAAAELPRRHAVLRQPPLRDHRRAAFLRHQQARPSPGALPGARRHLGAAGALRRPVRHGRRSAGHGGVPGRQGRGRDRAGRARRAAGRQHHRRPGAPAVGRPHGPSRGARGLQHHPPAQDLDRVREHARPGRAGVRPAVAHQRGEPGDRPASRLARRRAAPQGRGGDGRRQAARRGGDLLARPRHRLGRRRSRDPDGRAQGREPPDAAHRPRQPPAGRAQPRHDRAGQPLRGAGIAGRPRSRRGARARRRSAAAALPRRAGPAHRRLRLRPADRPRPALRGGADHAALPRTAAQGFRRHLRLRRHRRLCAGGLRALAPAEAVARRPLDAGLAPGGAAVPHECRHHRRTAADQGEAEARPHPGRGRGVLHPGPGAGRHLRLRRPHAALRGRQGTDRPVLARDRRRSQGAGLWRRPPAALDVLGRAGARHPAGSVAASQAAARGARMAAHAAHPLDPAGQQSPADRGFSRAAPSSSSSPTASRAGTRTRRWACC